MFRVIDNILSITSSRDDDDIRQQNVMDRTCRKNLLRWPHELGSHTVLKLGVCALKILSTHSPKPSGFDPKPRGCITCFLLNPNPETQKSEKLSPAS